MNQGTKKCMFFRCKDVQSCVPGSVPLIKHNLKEHTGKIIKIKIKVQLHYQLMLLFNSYLIALFSVCARWLQTDIRILFVSTLHNMNYTCTESVCVLILYTMLNSNCYKFLKQKHHISLYVNIICICNCKWDHFKIDVGIPYLHCLHIFMHGNGSCK